MIYHVIMMLLMIFAAPELNAGRKKINRETPKDRLNRVIRTTKHKRDYHENRKPKRLQHEAIVNKFQAKRINKYITKQKFKEIIKDIKKKDHKSFIKKSIAALEQKNILLLQLLHDNKINIVMPDILMKGNFGYAELTKEDLDILHSIVKDKKHWARALINSRAGDMPVIHYLVLNADHDNATSLRCIRNNIINDEKIWDIITSTKHAGNYPIHEAASTYSESAITLFTETDSKAINALNDAGETPLHIAMSLVEDRLDAGNSDVEDFVSNFLQFLFLQPSIDINIRDSSGKTARYYNPEYFDKALEFANKERAEKGIALLPTTFPDISKLTI